MRRTLPLLLTIAAVLWVAVLVSAPRVLHSSTYGWTSAAVYASCGRICHQRPERSFHAAGSQLPVCARCFGLYASGALGAVLAWLWFAPLRSGAARLILLLAALPTAVTWTGEIAGLFETTNMLRALAAVPLGAAAGWLFVQMLRYDADLDAGKIHDSRTRTSGV
jgi:uncharacterized membrane protein